MENISIFRIYYGLVHRRHLSYVSAISPTSLIVASGNSGERKEGGSEGGLSGFEPGKERS